MVGKRLGGHMDGVDRGAHAAVGGVLEAHGRREGRRLLPVQRAFHRARADRAPGQQLGVILRRHQVQDFRGCRHAQARAFQQYAPRMAQARADVALAVKPRVVDQALPAHAGARFFKIDAHHQQQRFAQPVRYPAQSRRVFQCRRGLVDRARAHDDQQPVIEAAQDVAGGGARRGDEFGFSFARRQFVTQQPGFRQRVGLGDMDVRDWGGHGVSVIRNHCSALHFIAHYLH